MQLGEILDGTFHIYRRHFGLFMRLSLVLICIPALGFVYLLVRTMANPIGTLNWFQTHIGTAILGAVACVLVWITISLLLKAGTIRIISDSYLGHEPSLMAALQFGTERIVPLLLVAICKALLIFVMYIGSILAFLAVLAVSRFLGALGILVSIAGGAGILWLFGYIMCCYALTTMIVVLEDLNSSFDAFSRSVELTRGSRLKVFFTWLVIVIFTAVFPWIVIQGASYFLGPESPIVPFLSLLSLVGGVVLAPLLPCALTLLYYDLRVRREAFDLQILSDQLGTR
ncbi:MAG: hypothetical protein AUH41_03050 [Gemmatimonadetes bacterium 13_1_40CM_66_11]|nr:MAG: hypothetical protein AUH41_03050 [Gemmatimonadetes bacterium 13_1_40CM_66_11]